MSSDGTKRNTPNVSINGKRLHNSLMQLASIGATERGGVCRLALTDLDRKARDLVVTWAQEAGMSVTVDAIGNIFMRREGERPSLPPIACGSHIDTQPTGGKFDGNYGVLAGLEVVRTLNDAGITTQAPLEVIVWTNEEGSRFVPVMMGSGVFAGAFSLESAYGAKDLHGASVRDELERIGYLGASPCGIHPLGAYFEAHIEQGPVLEDAGITIGAVTGVLGLRWYNCVVTGMEAHAGPTPMPRRKDALQASLRIMSETVAIAHRFAPHGRGTVGFVQVFPNSRNVIPGRVQFSIDLRHYDEAQLDAMERELHSCINVVRSDHGVSIALEQVSNVPACHFDAECIKSVERGAQAYGYAWMPAVSGAGHDAVYTARVTPTGMIFVPCKDGISHNEIEDAKPEDLEAGCNVLLAAMLDRAHAG